MIDLGLQQGLQFIDSSKRESLLDGSPLLEDSYDYSKYMILGNCSLKYS